MTPDEYNKRVLEELTALRKDVSAILGILRARGASGSPGANGVASDGQPIADDRDLDGDYGDPTIKFDPKEKYWQGESFVGFRFSECSAEYLDAMAKYLDACAWGLRKDNDPDKAKKAGYKEKDAARARGWAIRVRAKQRQGFGYQAQPRRQPVSQQPAHRPPGGYADEHTMPDHTGSYGGSDDEIPFVSCEPRGMRV